MSTLFLNIIQNEHIISGLIAIAGGLVGGVSTLWGVRWNLKKQSQDRAWDLFSEQLGNLLEISMLASQLYLEFSNLITLPNEETKKIGSKEKEILELLVEIYKKSAKVDNQTFSKIYYFEPKIRGALNDIFLERRIMPTNNVHTLAKEIKAEINIFLGFIQEHREELSHSYMKFKKS